MSLSVFQENMDKLCEYNKLKEVLMEIRKRTNNEEKFSKVNNDAIALLGKLRYLETKEVRGFEQGLDVYIEVNNKIQNVVEEYVNIASGGDGVQNENQELIDIQSFQKLEDSIEKLIQESQSGNKPSGKITLKHILATFASLCLMLFTYCVLTYNWGGVFASISVKGMTAFCYFYSEKQQTSLNTLRT